MITKLIDEEQIKPGDKLPSERELAEKLDVSRTAVREAFSVLKSSGIIKVQPGVGVFLKENIKGEIIREIKQITKGKDNEVSIIELLEVREAIEVQASGLAAERRDEIDLKKIYYAYKALEEAAKRDDIAAEEDLNFHIAVVEASRNQMFVEIMKLFYNRFLEGVHEWRVQDRQIPMDRKISLDTEHYEVYLAILEKDVEGARNAMQKHYENTKASYIKLND